MTILQNVSPASPSEATPVSFAFLYKCALLSTGFVPVFVIFNLLISCLVEGGYWAQLLWWIGGYMGGALPVALIARLVLGRFRESSLLRRCCFVLLLTLLPTLACVAWAENDMVRYMGFAAVVSMHVPLLFLWFFCRRIREAKSSPTVDSPGRRRIVGNTLFECSFIAVSPLVGVAYMALLANAEHCRFAGMSEFVLHLLVCLVPGWLAAAVVVTLIL